MYTPLLSAAAYYPELITLMCRKEADLINQADFEGVTLLHRIALQFEDDPFLNLTREKDYQALKEMYLHLLDILILNKADPTLKVSWGSSVLDLAEERARDLNDMDIYKKISSYLLKTKEAELFSFAGLLGALAGRGSPLHNTPSSSSSKDNGEVDKNELPFHS
ncbi:MAG: hypothetical protein P4L79_17695 [Legionella sp.]|uniref:hypothetical protein n=1 Tax=Legionella sp. TaxID=459 RepID=UPI0028516D73|nr:hypothetical protein [Legionella sp.]